ncbi:MAG: helix-turn-helix transcriptional regulator [Candidatus Methanofastidiosum sp.]|nr:helix-turn-helix transcriptional regulator [Candidatus Methanofastidiosa archaeon]NPV51409.1 helix-turn-helix transcriptional regulator [Methanofastidiosum sp.]HNZ87928.1 helix-turn-helix domain-containing protein [Methanofastidiosum sp.]
MDKKINLDDINKLLEKGKPAELLNLILHILDFKTNEIILYNLLLKSSLTIKQIEKELNLSERTIRKYLKTLEDEGFIYKRIERGKRLMYIYSSTPIQETWKLADTKIRDILGKITVALENKP